VEEEVKNDKLIKLKNGNRPLVRTEKRWEN